REARQIFFHLECLFPPFHLKRRISHWEQNNFQCPDILRPTPLRCPYMLLLQYLRKKRCVRLQQIGFLQTPHTNFDELAEPYPRCLKSPESIATFCKEPIKYPDGVLLFPAPFLLLPFLMAQHVPKSLFYRRPHGLSLLPDMLPEH